MSTGEKVVDLTVGEATPIDATIQTETDERDFGRSYKWSVVAKLNGTDGTPQVEIEGTNDGVNWANPYRENPADPNSPPLVIDLNQPVNSMMDDFFPFDKFRIKTLPNDNTTGTVEYKLCVHF